MPGDFPNWQTVYSQFRRWRLDGTWAQVLAELERRERAQAKKRNAEFADRRLDVRQEHAHGACKETKGYCWYKATNGIKWHLLVDTLGNPYFVRCTPANIGDDAALLKIIGENKQYFLTLPVGDTITILLDNGYHKEHLEQEIEKIDLKLANRIKIEIAAKITPPKRRAARAETPTKHGFVVIKRRWIVERTNAWLNQCRVLWKNCEGLLETSEAKIRICAIRLILRRIA